MKNDNELGVSATYQLITLLLAIPLFMNSTAYCGGIVLNIGDILIQDNPKNT